MSSTAVFSATTFMGGDHEAARSGRLDTQMSVEPAPPGRSDPNQSVSPSAEIAELVSKTAVFSSAIGVGALNGTNRLPRRANQTSPLPFRSDVK
jgi:hypothetical protein